MGSPVVVVVEVIVEQEREVTFAADERPVQTLVPDGLDHTLATPIGLWAAVGSEGNLGAFSFEYGVEVSDELGIAVVDEELDRALQVTQLPGGVASLLRHPRRVRVGGAAGEQESPASDLQEGEHKERAQECGVDGEEVAGEDSAGLSTKELAPGRTVTARRGWNTPPAQEQPNRGRRYAEAQLEELTLDTAIAPTRVFARQPENQLLQLGRDRWPAVPGTAGEGGPASLYQLAVPAHQGGRREEQTTSGESSTQSGEDQAVGGQEPWALDLAAEDGDLVAESHEFEVAVGTRMGLDHGEAEQESQQRIDGREDHEGGR